MVPHMFLILSPFMSILNNLKVRVIMFICVRVSGQKIALFDHPIRIAGYTWHVIKLPSNESNYKMLLWMKKDGLLVHRSGVQLLGAYTDFTDL